VLNALINQLKGNARIKKIIYVIGFLIGLAILIFLIYDVGIGSVYGAILSANIYYVILAFLILTLVLFLGGLNIVLFAICLGHKRRPFEIISTYILNWVVSQVVPIRISSLSLLLLLKKSKIKIKDGVAIILVDKIITLTALLALTAIGLFYFFPTNSVIKYPILFVILLLFITVLTLSARSERFLLSMLNSLKISSFVANNLEGFSLASKKIMRYKRLIIFNTLITFVKLLITALITYTIFLGFGAKANVFEFLLISIVVSALASLPITNAGLGVRELSAVVLYAQLMGIDRTVIASTYLIFLFLKYVFSIVFLIIYSLVKFTNGISKRMFSY